MSLIKPEDVRLPLLSSVAMTNLRLLPEAMAVYFVLDGLGVPLYIGQTVSLRTRLANHVHKKAFIDIEGCRCAWLLMPYEALTPTEIAMIDFFKPAMNKMKGGNTRPVTEATDYERITLRLPPSLAENLRADAAEARRPLNTQAIWYLEQYLDTIAAVS